MVKWKFLIIGAVVSLVGLMIEVVNVASILSSSGSSNVLAITGLVIAAIGILAGREAFA
ncbi:MULTISPECIES: hypothetical protein [Liquorilactobacillus]|uniref:Uncharacterized protein n=1 Tax=Liquorilactobacillus capillatus DSM 19910 TaxID=1423731 RepID=A0A0R1MGH8_9LACO|nr:hypothetical protein [Liquorilactobacillus capillatus]KRL03443.1 hypothetical protein FC81_GL002105 [Liquorilactobacillus capillatus DSM 19910]